MSIEQPFPLGIDGSSLDFYLDWSIWLQGENLASVTVIAGPGVIATSAGFQGNIGGMWVMFDGTEVEGEIYYATMKIASDSIPPRIETANIQFVAVVNNLPLTDCCTC